MKYYNISKIAAKGCEYNIIYGGRASGKSYQMGTYLLDEFIDYGHQFVRLIRSWGQGKGLDTYFQEIIDNDPKKYKGIKVELTQDKGFRYTCNGEIFGYVIPLSCEQNYKSTQYPNVVNVVYEEFVAPTPEDYVGGSENELRAFKSVLSTIFRHRAGRVWLVGNSMNTSNPYFEFFGIDGSTLKVGDLKKFTRMITLKGKSVPAASVAVEFVPIGYTDPNEIPIMMRIPDNEIAITGAIEESKNVVNTIHRVYNESGFLMGVIIDGIDPNSYNPLFMWVGESGTRYFVFQMYDGNFYIVEEYNANDNDIQLTIKDPTPEMMRTTDPKRVKSPNYIDETGVAVSKVYFNSSSTEYHYMTDVAKWTENDKQNKRLALSGGVDTSTLEGRKQLEEIANTKPGYVMNEIAARIDRSRNDVGKH